MTELKKKLIEEIEKIDDQLVIEQLTQLVSLSEQGREVEFTEEQIEKIEKSKLQIQNGESYDHKEVINSI